jgi:hypothetical protein
VWGVKYVARTPLIQNKIEIFFRKNTIFIITPKRANNNNNKMNKKVNNCTHCPKEIIIENIDPTVYDSTEKIFYALKNMHLGVISDVIPWSVIPLYVPNGPAIPTLQVKAVFLQWNLFHTREMRRWFEAGLRVRREVSGDVWYLKDVIQQRMIYAQKQRMYELRTIREGEETRIIYYPPKCPGGLEKRGKNLDRHLGLDYRATDAELCEMGQVYEYPAKGPTGYLSEIIGAEFIEIVIE